MVWPCDPQSGGTWIGVNDAGLAMVLLNRAPRQAAPTSPTTSRGVLIPRLLHATDLDAAAARARMRLTNGATPRFDPFTLVMIQRRAVVVLDYDNGLNSVTRHRLIAPLLFTSSSLGDEVVDRPRRRLFAALVQASRRPLAGQARFHRHRWRDRPDLSVWMARPDAATVSRTVVDVRSNAISVAYAALTVRDTSESDRSAVERHVHRASPQHARF